MLEIIHSSTGSAGLALKGSNKTEVDRYFSYLKISGFKQEIALLSITFRNKTASCYSSCY